MRAHYYGHGFASLEMHLPKFNSREGTYELKKHLADLRGVMDSIFKSGREVD
jgi:hypothetical protein